LDLDEEELVVDASEADPDLDLPLLEDSLELDASDLTLEADELPTLDSLPTLEEEPLPELLTEAFSLEHELTLEEGDIPELMAEELSLDAEPTLEIPEAALEEASLAEEAPQPLETASEDASY